MCGICGFMNLDDSRLNQGQANSQLNHMLDRLTHRGPDGHGMHHSGPVSLGHARLSIIDLAGGKQPLLNEDGSVALVCNGEIYNFAELRSELIASGHQFRSGSDSEVILHLWEEVGPELVHRLRGMFAFVIYDSRQEILFGARDHFGQKPLYYRRARSEFSFASEIKSLLTLPGVSRDLDLVALDQFLFYQFVPNPRTMFQEVRQLPPGSHFLLRKGQFEITRWWQPEFEPVELPNSRGSNEELIDRAEAEVLDAVRSHLVSDVPVGVFLSGGIDSSLMVAMAAHLSQERLSTFSISFRGTQSDEGPYARLAAERFQTDHHEYSFDANQIADCLSTVGRIFDQPLADSATLPLLFLSRHASRDIKVVLTGDGGDELFGGYRKYRRAAEWFAQTRLSQSLGRSLLPASRLARVAADRMRWKRWGARVALAASPRQRTTYYRNYWEGWDRHALYQPALRDALPGDFPAVDDNRFDASMHPVNAMLQIDQSHYLPDDLLLKTDHATMAHGLEARAPLLDSRLAQYAAKLPVEMKVTPQTTKVILREIARRWLPQELSERPKKGFSFPIRDWFRGPLHQWLRNIVLDESTLANAYFQRSHISRVLDEHQSGKRNHGGRLYSLLTLELWHREFAFGQSSMERSAA